MIGRLFITTNAITFVIAGYAAFGLQLVPIACVLGGMAAIAASDARVIARDEKRFIQRLIISLTMPLTNFLVAFSEYRAARDEIRSVKIKIQDV